MDLAEVDNRVATLPEQRRRLLLQRAVSRRRCCCLPPAAAAYCLLAAACHCLILPAASLHIDIASHPPSSSRASTQMLWMGARQAVRHPATAPLAGASPPTCRPDSGWLSTWSSSSVRSRRPMPQCRSGVPWRTGRAASGRCCWSCCSRAERSSRLTVQVGFLYSSVDLLQCRQLQCAALCCSWLQRAERAVNCCVSGACAAAMNGAYRPAWCRCHGRGPGCGRPAQRPARLAAL